MKITGTRTDLVELPVLHNHSRGSEVTLEDRIAK